MTVMNKEINNKNIRPAQNKAQAKNPVKVNNPVNDSDDRVKKLKYYSIGSVVILIAIVLLSNILFDGIFGKALTFDFSDTNQNTISQVSVDYLNSLSPDDHIRIVGLFERPENIAGTEYQCIVPLLDDYVKKSGGRITVEYVNMTEQPNIISQLDPSNSYDLSSKTNSYVIEHNGRIKIVDPIDCYVYDEAMSSYYGSYFVIGNNAEFAFTNAMYNLTGDYAFRAYIVTGLKEAGNTYLTKVLESMNIEVFELQTSENFAIPDDCDLLILNGPNNDISEKMYVAMSDYLNRGGNMFVAVDYSIDNVHERFDRLNLLLNQMGINIDPNLISENDPGYQLSGSNVDSTVTAVGEFADYAGIPYLHSTYARSIRKVESVNSGITSVPVLLTSNKAAALEVDAQGNVTDNTNGNENQYNVAMYAVSDSYEPSQVFVFGTMNFSSDEYISAYGLNETNVEFLRSCIRKLSGDKPINGLNVPTKNVEDFSLNPDKSTTSLATAMLVIFMIAIPVILVSMAVIVYTKRKNL